MHVRMNMTVEHYEVPVFVRRSRPQRGAGVRMTRVECAPGSVDALIEEFRNTGVPALMDMPGLCSAHMTADRATGRCMVITALGRHGRPGRQPVGHREAAR